MSVDKDIDEGKTIIKSDALPGVDKSNSDYTLLSTIQPSCTVVTKAIWKVKGKTFIGVKQHVQPGNVIRVGNMGLTYKVIRLMKVEGTRNGKGGMIFRIKRADGNLTTNVDLDNIFKGQTVKILGRQNYIDTLDHPWGRDYVEPCPPEVKTTLPCDPEDEDCNCK